MFTEDPTPFLADFSQTVTLSTGESFPALLDQPDELIPLQDVHAVSRQYQLTWVTASCPAIQRGAVLTLEDVHGQFLLREPPRQIDDGLFSRALITRSA